MFLWLPSPNGPPHPEQKQRPTSNSPLLGCITICSNPPLAPVAYIVVAGWRTTRLIANKPFQGRVSRTRPAPKPGQTCANLVKRRLSFSITEVLADTLQVFIFLTYFFDNSIMGVMHVWCVCVIAWSVGPMDEWRRIISMRFNRESSSTTMQWSLGGGGQERADGDLSRRHCKRRRLSSADRKLGNKHRVRNMVKRRNA